MSIHMAAKMGDIAPAVLLPGDPLRARYIAEHFLENAVCYNEIRSMLGYTGAYKGKRVSVQGTGMGIPSLAIYVEELLRDYGCRTLIRVGSCGTIQEGIHIRDIILVMGASTDSQINKITFKGQDYAATADFELLKRAHDYAAGRGIPVKVGNVMSTDTFYNQDKDFYEVWRKHGILAYEMESSALFTLAARYGAKSLTILTVSDSILSGEEMTAEERERTLATMCEVALNTV
ncbi:MAG: purine-nucleoside phosphorylase [Candidatus Eremiobacteraeota bacterium]|nr:purine-nucleoside phosphorylase [Candidatus Eremiobacteraeota bacterium]